MMMETVFNATEVRKDWGHFIDTVVRVRPQFVKRSRDTFVVVSSEHLKSLLALYRVKLEVVQEEDGSFSGSLDVLDLVANASTIENLKDEIAHQMVEYANEYEDEFVLCFNAPNRRAHAPYVMNILLQDTIGDVVALIDTDA